MATDATIPRVARPRGELTASHLRWLKSLAEKRAYYEKTYRDYCVWLLSEGCSFNEVSKATGLSTATLQRWKREANDAH